MYAITLDKSERKKVEEAAKKMASSFRRSKKFGKHIAKHKFSHKETMLNGLGFELAVAQYLGINHNFYDHNGHDNGRDLFFNGQWIDTKCVQPNRPDFLMRTFNKKMRADIYIFGTGTFPSYEILGFVYHNEIFQDKYIGFIKFNGKLTKRYIYPRKLAHDIENIWK